MADRKGLYQTLEVSPSVSDDEIRKAYRKLALRWHPDKNPDDPEATAKFQKISAAYAVLSDEKQRAQYDRTGSTGDDDDLGGFGDFGDFGDLDQMMEMFAAAFGGGFSMDDGLDEEIAFLLGGGGGGRRRRKGKMSSGMRANLGPGVRGAGGRGSSFGRGGRGMGGMPFGGMGGMSAEEEEAFNEVMFGMAGMGLGGGKGSAGGYPGGKGGAKGCPPGMPPELLEMMAMMGGGGPGGMPGMGGMVFEDDSDDDIAAFAREFASSATEVKREAKPRGRNEPLRPKKPKKKR